MSPKGAIPIDASPVLSPAMPGNDRGGPFPARQGSLFDGGGRAALLERWLELTRTALPAMAAAQGWPIRLDHCFMRVCLDAAIGTPWTATVTAPALRHMTDAQLAAAVAVAESVAADPGRLPALDASSRNGRRARRIPVNAAAPRPPPCR